MSRLLTSPPWSSAQLESVFLKTPQGTFTFADVERFTADLELKLQHIAPGEIIQLHSQASAACALTIAALWMLGRPFAPVATSSDEISLLTAIHDHSLFHRITFKNDISHKSSPTLIDQILVATSSLASTDRLIQPVNATVSQTNWSTAPFSDDALFGIFQTSGTTSKAKLVPIRRGQIRQAADSAAKNFMLNPGELWYHALPLHHIGGVSVITRALHWGSGVYLDERFDVSRFVSLLEDGIIAAASMVPTQLQRLRVCKLHIPECPHFRAILLGGGPIPADIITYCKSVNLPVVSSFGMTETAAQCIAIPLSQWQTWPADSCGIPLAGIETDIRPDPEFPHTKIGLLWLRGPQIFDGYVALMSLHDPLRTSLLRDDFDENGWFCTGDYARMDQNGCIFIEMRRTDRIVTGGENVNPNEVEQAIRELGGFEDLAVVGLPDPEWGQIVTLFVTSKSPILDENTDMLSSIRDMLKPMLSAFKLPRRLVVVEHIPRTPSGKVQRHLLQEAPAAD